jgi:hypothetical protein
LTATITDTDPVRRPGDDVERQPRALQLRQQVEAADQQHDPGGEHPQTRAPEPRLGEVGDRVRAEPPQRRGDEQQQRQVAGGEAERLPQCARAQLQLQPGDPEEARRRQVFARDRGGVPPCCDRA